MPNDPFVDVSDLSSFGRLRYLDVRDQVAFDAAHAPGAVRVPLDEWDAAAKAADTGFVKTAYWDNALNALGLNPTVTAVAYDSGGMTNAARVWFILQYYGLNAVILNGGWPALASETGLPPAAAPSAGGFRAVPGSGSVGLVDRETLRDQLDGRAQVFDTRTRAEFTGEDARNRARSGHLPGARHLSHVDLIENGVVRPAPALRAMLERVGFGPGDHIVTHCEGGGRAALGAAAAVRAGFDDVRVYYLSFGDWVRDEGCPIVAINLAALQGPLAATFRSWNRATYMALIRYHSALFQDQLQTPHVCDVFERVGSDHNQVGELAHLHRAQFGADAAHRGGMARGRYQRLPWRRAVADPACARSSISNLGRRDLSFRRRLR